MHLGVHVSAEGGVFETFERAQALGCNAMQFFARNPQRWRVSRLAASDIEEFKKRRAASRIKPIFIHVPYLVNLATPRQRLYKGSIGAYIEDIKEAASLKADYVVTHMGSYKGSTEQEGLDRFIKALSEIVDKTKNTGVGILLENTSGSGSWLGYDFKHQKAVFEGLKFNKRLGLCLDTAHAYSAGYDIATKDGLDATLEEIDMLVGLDRLKLIHLNDSKDKFFGHNDRHEHIGKGTIGLAGMKRIVNHPKLKDVAFILETPKDSLEADPANLATVKRLRKK